MQLPAAMYIAIAILMCMQLFVCNIQYMASYVAVNTWTFNMQYHFCYLYVFLKANQKQIASKFC